MTEKTSPKARTSLSGMTSFHQAADSSSDRSQKNALYNRHRFHFNNHFPCKPISADCALIYLLHFFWTSTLPPSFINFALVHVVFQLLYRHTDTHTHTHTHTRTPPEIIPCFTPLLMNIFFVFCCFQQLYDMHSHPLSCLHLDLSEI